VVRNEKVDLATDRVAVRFVGVSDGVKGRIRRLVEHVLDLEQPADHS